MAQRHKEGTLQITLVAIALSEIPILHDIVVLGLYNTYTGARGNSR